MRRLNRTNAWAAVVMLAAILPARAAGQPAGQAPETSGPAVTTEMRTQFAVSYNNAGLQQSLEWSRRRLLQPGTGALTADAHLAFGSQVTLSPSYVRVSAWGQVAPVSFLTLRVGVEPAHYFGTFDSLMSFDRQDEPFDNDSRRDRGGAASGRVLRVYATPSLRGRVGHVTALVTADVERWVASAPGPWFYEPTRDTLLDTGGDDVLASRAVILYEHVTAAGTRLGVGGIHTFQQVDGRALNQVQRLGVISTLQSDGRWHFLRRPAVTVIVARYLEDPSKDGQWFAALTAATTLRRR